MRFARAHKVTTFVLALVAATPLLASGEVGWALRLIFPIMAILGWFVEPPIATDPRYRRAITLLVFLVLAIQSFRYVLGAPMAMMGMEFAIALLGLKLLSRGHASDYQQIAILSFLQIIAGTVAMDDLLFAGVFVVFVALCPPVLALSYLRKEMEQRFGERPNARGGEMLGRLLLSKRVISPRFLVGSSMLSFPVLVITAILFITFPRIGFGLFGNLSEKRQIVGFGDKVTLGDLDILHMDETVLIRLQPFGFDRKPPKSLSIKLRGAVFDRYENSTWTKSRPEAWRGISSRGSDYILDNKFFVRTVTPGYEVLLESMRPSLVFIPEGTGVIATHRTAEGGQPRVRPLTASQYGTVRYEDTARVGLRYNVYLTSAPLFGDAPDDTHDYLQLPQKSERLQALAVKLAGDYSTEDRVRKLVFELKNNYGYSMKLASSKANALADTPLNRFLFTRRTGTCEHFATALTLMLRAVGVPARIATGFSGADWNSVGGYYAVRNRFAHSWTEAFIGGKWRSLDATPPGSGPEDSWQTNRLALFMDTMRMRWHKHIVGYDAASQFEVAMGLRSIWIKMAASKRASAGIPWRWIFVVVGCFGAGALVYVLRRRKTRVRGASADKATPTRTMREATKLYLSMEKRLARRGYTRPRHRTPREHMRTLVDAEVPFANILEEVVDRYNQIRFGRRFFGAEELERLRSLIREI